MPTPADRAGCRIGADQVAIGAESVHGVRLDGRGAARTGIVGTIVSAHGSDLGGPKDFAIGAVKSHQELFFLLAAHEEDPAAGDGRRGVAAAQPSGFPKQFRAAFRPVFQQAGFGGNTSAVRTTPAGPVRGADLERSWSGGGRQTFRAQSGIIQLGGQHQADRGRPDRATPREVRNHHGLALAFIVTSGRRPFASWPRHSLSTTRAIGPSPWLVRRAWRPGRGRSPGHRTET